MGLDIKELIQECQKNNRTAQKELFIKFRSPLYITSLKYCKNEIEAEDNLQDTFVIIFKTIKAFNGKGSFEGWMQRITINQAIKKFKSQKRVICTPSDEYYKDELEVSEEDLNVPLHTILKAIQQLPDQYRLVFNLYELDQFSHKEIAEKLSISEGTSKSNLHRAKVILRKNINLQTKKK